MVPFYERILAEVKLMLTKIVDSEPEIRSLSLTIDWVGQLNTSVPGCLWVGRGTDNAVDTSEAISGSIQQTARMLTFQTERANQLAQQIKRRLDAVTSEAHNEERQQKPGQALDRPAGSAAVDQSPTKSG